MSQQYVRRTTCRFCNSRNLRSILDFGEVALAGGFLLPEQFKDEQKYSLELFFCVDCYLLQVINVIPSEVLFSNYFYFSSAIRTLRQHFEQYAKEVTDRFLAPGQGFVVEIGCNDGVLLKPFRDLGIKTLGVDRATNVVEPLQSQGITVINDLFTEEVAARIREAEGPANVIAANNVYAHIDDMHDVTQGIRTLLAEDGVFIFEVHYISHLIEHLQYDMIYHEHMSYYSLLALDNFFAEFDLEIFDVKPIPIHAGSMRYYVRKIGGRPHEPVSEAVHQLRMEERNKGYDKVETYLSYADEVNQTRATLLNLLYTLKEAGKSVVGYGASGRANTVIQYCALDHQLLDYMIDDAPAKLGYYTPGSHFLIRSREALLADHPDYVLVFAWSFIEEIIARSTEYLEAGGKFILPLPSVRIRSLEGESSVEEETTSLLGHPTPTTDRST